MKRLGMIVGGLVVVVLVVVGAAVFFSIRIWTRW